MSDCIHGTAGCVTQYIWLHTWGGWLCYTVYLTAYMGRVVVLHSTIDCMHGPGDCVTQLIPHPVASEHRWLVKPPLVDSQCPGCLGQAVVTLRLPCAIVESPRRRRYVPFVNITSLRCRSIKRRQWKHKLNYYDVVFAHLATGRGINAKDPSGLDSDRWIPHSRCCENPARAKALAGFSRHLSVGFTDLNPAPRGLSQ